MVSQVGSCAKSSLICLLRASSLIHQTSVTVTDPAGVLHKSGAFGIHSFIYSATKTRTEHNRLPGVTLQRDCEVWVQTGKQL